jgi:hypothetical protein
MKIIIFAILAIFTISTVTYGGITKKKQEPAKSQPAKGVDGSKGLDSSKGIKKK